MIRQADKKRRAHATEGRPMRGKPAPEKRQTASSHPTGESSRSEHSASTSCGDSSSPDPKTDFPQPPQQKRKMMFPISLWKMSTILGFVGGLVAVGLDLVREIELLLSIERYLARGLIFIWMLEFLARIGRSLHTGWTSTDSLPWRGRLSGIWDSVETAVVDGLGLYLLLIVWLVGVQAANNTFRETIFAEVATFLQVASAFGIFFYLLGSAITWAAGSRKRALSTIGAIIKSAQNARKGDPEAVLGAVDDTSPQKEKT